MVKTTIKEVTEKFDKNGTLIERLTREEFIEDDEVGLCGTTTNPYFPVDPALVPNKPKINPILDLPIEPIKPWYKEPYCSTETIPEGAAKGAVEISNIDDICELSGTNSGYVYGIKAEPIDSISNVINKTEAISTENAFKQAVSRCIR